MMLRPLLPRYFDALKPVWRRDGLRAGDAVS